MADDMAMQACKRLSVFQVSCQANIKLGLSQQNAADQSAVNDDVMMLPITQMLPSGPTGSIAALTGKVAELNVHASVLALDWER